MSKEKYILTISIVLYNHKISMVENLLKCINRLTINYRVYIIDNSNTKIFTSYKFHENIVYVKTNKNLGFGAGHNIAIDKVKDISNYHLILNPDITFENTVIENLIHKLSNNMNYGIVMPKILYPNKSLQICAKLLPSPFNLITRRLFPKSKYLFNYELRLYNYEKIIEAPFLSGCFMLCRTDILSKIGGFDDKLFLYMEDVDLCRRINLNGYKTIVYPFEYVIHDHEYKPLMISNTLKYFLKSAFYYFNKWGWFIDNDRNILNRRTLRQF
jgi:GT2 family glycosyltransferase